MVQNNFKILIIGDIVGRPGREFLFQNIETIIKENQIDFVIANGENSSGGRGISCKSANELLNHHIDVITTGNHVWRSQDIFKIIDTETRILRPLNYPEGVPGKGYFIYSKNNLRILVVSLLGRINLMEVDCPFQKMDWLFKILNPQDYDISILDFHSETTSEKAALGHYLDGRIHVLVGTHTHIQTADEKILPKGTAYITDIGMTGSFDSVIGVEKQAIIDHFITRMPIKFQVAEEKPGINSVIVDYDVKQKKVIDIKRYNLYS